MTQNMERKSVLTKEFTQQVDSRQVHANLEEGKRKETNRTASITGKCWKLHQK